MNVAVASSTSPPRRAPWAAILFVAGVAAVWAVAVALAAGGHGGGEHAHLHHGGHHGGAAAPGYLALLGMWTAMMVAMMVPAEWPLLATSLRGARGLLGSGLFFLGLLVAWAAVSALLALGHRLLEASGRTLPGGVLADSTAAALLLGAIGVFQLTPLKRMCLDHCRRARVRALDGGDPGRSLLAGLQQGTTGMGSCAFLMLLPFAYGGMALAPMAAVTALLAVEKAGRPGLLAARAAGLALVGWSAMSLVTG